MMLPAPSVEEMSAWRDYMRLPGAARAAFRKDLLRTRHRGADPGTETAIEEAIQWLYMTQDRSASRDNGSARHYSLINGWGSSYPETTGYIIPTLLEHARATGSRESLSRAERMLDWLVSIQLREGAFQGGTVDSQPVSPVVFNTGQILLGLTAGVKELGAKYKSALMAAGDWLTRVQDADGCWRRFSSPFAGSGEKAYDAHVAWGLLVAERVVPGRGYAEAALKNLHWSLQWQHENGWLDKCCLTDPSRPLTHTIGYTLRGLIEGYRFSGDRSLLYACFRTADGLLQAVRDDGFLPGRLLPTWRPGATWSCLTGSAQISCCWLNLFEMTGKEAYRDSALRVNEFLRHVTASGNSVETRGALKGSFPVYGGYCTYEYPNWATKFFIDANMLEQALKQKEKMLVARLPEQQQAGATR